MHSNPEDYPLQNPELSLSYERLYFFVASLSCKRRMSVVLAYFGFIQVRKERNQNRRKKNLQPQPVKLQKEKKESPISFHLHWKMFHALQYTKKNMKTCSQQMSDERFSRFRSPSGFFSPSYHAWLTLVLFLFIYLLFE